MTDKAFLDLLGLQAIDTEIDQLLHAREALPELERFKEAHEAITSLKATASPDAAPDPGAITSAAPASSSSAMATGTSEA